MKKYLIVIVFILGLCSFAFSQKFLVGGEGVEMLSYATKTDDYTISHGKEYVRIALNINIDESWIKMTTGTFGTKKAIISNYFTDKQGFYHFEIVNRLGEDNKMKIVIHPKSGEAYQFMDYNRSLDRFKTAMRIINSGISEY